jgi:hypothetical protein
MTFEGQIRKMITENGNPIRYYLNLREDYIDLNQQLGKKIKIQHQSYECLGCGLNKEIFRMGYCKNCFFTLPEANESIIRPELSKAHLGIQVRDLEWERKFELQAHIVYLAVSPDMKVGVTRATQIPTRWIDQGANAAIILARTENRYEAGMIEVALKNYTSDKTNYQRMLKNERVEVDLIHQKELFKIHIPEAESKFYLDDDTIYTFEYPVQAYPTKVKSLNLKKEVRYEGILTGIKGQYLIFADGTVWNVRGHEGFYVTIEI